MSKFRSLKFKIIGMCSTLVLLMGLTALLLVLQTTHQSRQDVKKSYQGLATNLSESIAAQFFERYGDVQAFAQNTVLASGSPSEIVSVLNNYATLYGIYDLIFYVDLNGKLVAVNSVDPKGNAIQTRDLYNHDFNKEKWFQEVKEGRFTEEREKGFARTYFEDVVMDPLVNKTYSKTAVTSGFTAQVKNSQGELIGIISNRANFSWVEGEFVMQYANLSARGLKRTELSLTGR